jgi:hypothetical protein
MSRFPSATIDGLRSDTVFGRWIIEAGDRPWADWMPWFCASEGTEVHTPSGSKRRSGKEDSFLL